MGRGWDGGEDKLMKAHPCVIGLLGEEFGYSWASSRSMPYGVKTCRDRGGYLFWTFLDNFNRFIDGSGRQFRLSSHERMYDFIKEYGKWFVFEVKANGTRYQDKKRDWEAFGEFIKATEITAGSWLTGLVDNWGYQPEDWLWYEKGYSRWYEYSEPYDRGRYGVDLHGVNNQICPENLIAMEVLLASIHGSSMFTFEIGLGGGDRASHWHEYAILPVLKEIAPRKLIPPREDALKRVRVASDGSFRTLYATTSCVLQNNGRYGLIPWLPKHTPDSERKKFEFLPGDYDYRDLPFINALYPIEGRGRSFIERQGRYWYVMNPYENIRRDTDFELPLYANTCRSLSGRVGPHTYAIVEEAPDRIDVAVNNFRLDKSEIWANRHAFLPIGQIVPPEVTRATWARVRKAMSQSRLKMMRKTSFVLLGHTGTAPPKLTISGHDGFRHEERWDKITGRYELDIFHNGMMHFTLEAAGKETDKRPPQGLSRNIALDRRTAASSAAKEHPASAATDGLYHTCWQADGTGPQWLGVDLGKEVAVTAYKVAHGSGTDAPPIHFKFQTAAASAGPWTTRHEATCAGERVRAFAVEPGPAARHARLLFDASPKTCYIREFGVYTGPADELKTWAPIADPTDMAAILALLSRATSDAERGAIESAAVAAWRKSKDKDAGIDLLLKTFRSLDELEAASVVRIIGRTGAGGKVLAALREMERDKRGEVSEAASWSLVYRAAGTGPLYTPGPGEHPFRLKSGEDGPPSSDWRPGKAVLADLRRIARLDTDLSLRSHALRAILGVMQDTELPQDLQRELACEGFRLATEGRNKLGFLEHLGKLTALDTLQAIATRMNDEDYPKLKEWTRLACVQKCRQLRKRHPKVTTELLGSMLQQYGGSASQRQQQLCDAIIAVFAETASEDKTPPLRAPSGLTAKTPSPFSVKLDWDELPALADPESAISGYVVHRGTADGREIARLDRTTSSWTDGNLRDATAYTYRVCGINHAGAKGPWATVQVTTKADLTPPRVRGVCGSSSQGKIFVWFSKPVDEKSAVAVGNYRLDGGPKVTGVRLGDTARTVILTAPGLEDAKELKLHVANVRDRATKPNTMAAATCRFKPASVLPGLRYAEYGGRPREWDVAALKKMKPRKEQTVPGFDLATVKPGPKAVLRYVGAVHAPVHGMYMFSLRTRRDSKLYINGKPLVTGGHKTLEFSSGVELEAGMHGIAVIYQHEPETGGLSVRWQGPGFAKEPIPVEALFHFDAAARALREMEAGLDPARRKPAAPPSADIEDDIDLDL